MLCNTIVIANFCRVKLQNYFEIQRISINDRTIRKNSFSSLNDSSLDASSWDASSSDASYSEATSLDATSWLIDYKSDEQLL